jgi:hypothetical protein
MSRPASALIPCSASARRRLNLTPPVVRIKPRRQPDPLTLVEEGVGRRAWTQGSGRAALCGTCRICYRSSPAVVELLHTGNRGCEEEKGWGQRRR